MTFNLLERDEEYDLLSKQYKLKRLYINQFVNFIFEQKQNDNYVYDLLSKCLIEAKNIFLEKYQKDLGIRNIQNLDSSVDDAFNNIFLENLNK